MVGNSRIKGLREPLLGLLAYDAGFVTGMHMKMFNILIKPVHTSAYNVDD